MKNVFKCVIPAAALLLVFLAGSAAAQTWSEEQTEVWQYEQALWELWANKDFDGMMACYHENYSGWGADDAAPAGKETVTKWLNYRYASNSVEIYEISPMAIVVVDDVAVAHYVYTIVVASDEGGKNTYTGKWTDVMKKQGDKWLIIADHGSPDDDD